MRVVCVTPGGSRFDHLPIFKPVERVSTLKHTTKLQTSCMFELVCIPPCAVVVLRRLMAHDDTANKRIRGTMWQRGTRRGANTDNITAVKQASELTNKSQRTNCGVSGARLCRTVWTQQAVSRQRTQTRISPQCSRDDAQSWTSWDAHRCRSEAACAPVGTGKVA